MAAFTEFSLLEEGENKQVNLYGNCLISHKKKFRETFLMVQWLSLPVNARRQGRVRSLFWEDPTSCGATKPVCEP